MSTGSSWGRSRPTPWCRPLCLLCRRFPIADGRRAQPRAQAAIEHGREYATRACSDGLLLDLAVLAGEAWIDLARLDEAEAVLATAATAARAASDGLRIGGASLALARASFWRGRYADADA